MTVDFFMRCQPASNAVSDDVVMTPPELAERLVAHFSPSGRVLEPCLGSGNMYRALRAGSPKAELYWCERMRGKDFYDWTGRVDWVFTNPPWSKIRPFLAHSMLFADHIVFLMTVNHAWTKARLRDMRQAGFGLKEICCMETPEGFPQSGFQLGAVYYRRGWRGPCEISELKANE